MRDRRLKIVWGVCGIGHGHSLRQKPLIEYFSKRAEITIFAYGESLDYFKKHFECIDNITIERVAVPFYVGNKQGLDFDATLTHPANQNLDFHTINTKALRNTARRLGNPDLVITDYEPISAQYGSMMGAPVVTLDQQSKYLKGSFPDDLNGQGYKDEVQRLRLFFPNVEGRIACSFFQVASKKQAREIVDIYPPIINAKIRDIDRRKVLSQKSIVVYISAQQAFGQRIDDMSEVCAHFPDYDFHFFGKNLKATAGAIKVPNVYIYDHGDGHFERQLACCEGIVSTAGHTLLSEAMYLGIPVYAIPLPVYEQQMNAHIIHENGFGLSHQSFDRSKLQEFLDNIGSYEASIKADQSVLLKGNGKDKIIQKLKSFIR